MKKIIFFSIIFLLFASSSYAIDMIYSGDNIICHLDLEDFAQIHFTLGPEKYITECLVSSPIIIDDVTIPDGETIELELRKEIDSVDNYRIYCFRYQDKEFNMNDFYKFNNKIFYKPNIFCNDPDDVLCPLVKIGPIKGKDTINPNIGTLLIILRKIKKQIVKRIVCLCFPFNIALASFLHSLLFII